MLAAESSWWVLGMIGIVFVLLAVGSYMVVFSCRSSVANRSAYVAQRSWSTPQRQRSRIREIRMKRMCGGYDDEHLSWGSNRVIGVGARGWDIDRPLSKPWVTLLLIVDDQPFWVAAIEGADFEYCDKR